MITKVVTAIGTFAIITLSSFCLHKSKKQNEDKRKEILAELCKEDAEKPLRNQENMRNMLIFHHQLLGIPQMNFSLIIFILVRKKFYLKILYRMKL